MTETDVKRCEGKKLRIYGPVIKQEIQRERTNQELRELYKDVVIVSDSEKERLEWIGHVVRMGHVREVKENICE
jgi:hypothetical protein